MDRTDLQLVTPREAARLAGCGRSSIMRALASRALPATRDNHNAWLIRREDLDQWSGTRTMAGPVTGPGNDRTMSEPVTGPGPDPGTAARLAAAEARVEALAGQVADLRQERDRLFALTERLSESLAERQAEREHAGSAEPQPAPPRSRLLGWLLGRGRAHAA